MDIYDADASDNDLAKYLYAYGTLAIEYLKRRVSELVASGATIDADEGRLMCERLYDVGSILDVATIYWKCIEPTYSDGAPVVILERMQGNGLLSEPPVVSTNDRASAIAGRHKFDTLCEAVYELASPAPGWRTIVTDPPPDKDRAARLAAMRELFGARSGGDHE